MRIRKVRAHAFGPFEDRTLELAEGMTVIVGPNEASKSSWHAAIYAGLCGMRRGRGRRTTEDEEFAQRHEPWDGDEWEISCIVDLPDGRKVELHHDLSGRVDCTARDLDLGTDITNEIIHDGAPDGSRWLGLERRAFLAVASIRQGQILSITENAGALQEHLQRAAATAGTDETAVAALKSIDDYSREHVGTERVNSQKPLMQALRHLEQAKDADETAVAQHKERLRRQEQVGGLADRANEARNQARAVGAHYAQQLAAQMNGRFLEAKTLAERHSTPPPDLQEDAELAETVATALHDWANHPDPEPLIGPTALELEERLSALPTSPEGDLEPAPSVQSARRILLNAQARYDAHLRQRPPEESMTQVGETTAESELVDLARELEMSVPQADPELIEEAERLREALARDQSGKRRVRGIGLGIGAVAAFLLGAGLLGTGASVAGFVGVGVGVLLGVISAVLIRTPVDEHGAELRSAEAKLLVAEQLAATARQRQENAAVRVVALRLDPDPANLRRIADELRRAELANATRESWEEEQRPLADAATDAIRALAQALNERGVAVKPSATVDELEAQVTRYEEECQQRRDTAAVAREHPAIEQALDVRRRAESQLAEDEERLQRARQALRDAASAADIIDDHGIDSLSEGELVSRLRAWRETREQQRDDAERARKEWSRLQALLDGSTVGELEARVHAALAKADNLRGDVDDDLLIANSLGDDPELTVQEHRQRAESLERDVAAAQRELEIRAEQALSVAEAEEQLADADEELKRVKSLAGVLEKARTFLAAAQERVHHDIAPILASKVRDRLARVTGGRYDEASVDPETLNVQVRDTEGRWRNAELLSHGTAEQVYLLLRVAMAEILTEDGVNCPLLFDDSTVQSDPQRTWAILDVLHEVSGEHQVIVFSQEGDVIAWAQDHLGTRDQLLSLDVEPLRHR